MTSHFHCKHGYRTACEGCWKEGVAPAPAPEPPQEILQIRDAIVSTQRALRSLVRVGGDGVRIVKSADVKVAKRDAEDRLAYVLEILERVEAGVRVSERPAPPPCPMCGSAKTFHDTLTSCAACGEQFYTRDQSLASSAAYKAAGGTGYGN